MNDALAAEAQAAIAARSRAFEQAYAAGDATALVTTYFVDDALAPMACPPGGQAPVRGRAALIAMFSGMFAAMPKIRLHTDTLVVDQAQAFELGRAHLTSADGTHITGRYTVCWLKSQGEWRAKVDFFAEDGWND